MKNILVKTVKQSNVKGEELVENVICFNDYNDFKNHIKTSFDEGCEVFVKYEDDSEEKK